MPQKTYPILENEFYHVFNRGVDKREIFLDKEDYLRFYQSLNLFNSISAVVNFDFALLQAKKETHHQEPLVEITAYSLLPNHFHLLVKPITDKSLSEFMRRISSGYTSYFNQKYERNGSLFQGSFKRYHISTPEQYNYLFAYVNENHFVHNLERANEIYLSSSYHYQGTLKSKLITQDLELSYNLEENTRLAKDIYKQRQNTTKQKLFE